MERKYFQAFKMTHIKTGGYEWKKKFPIQHGKTRILDTKKAQK